jgi:hypothetical protein
MDVIDEDMRFAIKHRVAALHGKQRERLGDVTFPNARRAGNILPILTNLILPFIIAFIRVTASDSVSFERTASAESERTLSNSVTAL